MASPGAAKEVTIKTGVVKRLIKELNYYEKEAEMESAKLNDMKAKGDLDVHDINKQAEILQVSLYILRVFCMCRWKWKRIRMVLTYLFPSTVRPF